MIPLLLYVPPLLDVGRLDVKTVTAVTMVQVLVAGVFGKVVTGQVPLVPTLAVVLGAVPGAQVGALVSRRLSGSGLRRVLFVVTLGSAVRVWWDLLVPGGH